MNPADLDRDLPTTALALARLFADGGRLLAAAPGKEDHARHVAVEFIHPAVAGARSLPAAAIAEEELESEVSPQDAVILFESDHRSASTALPPAGLTVRVPSSMSDPDLVRWYHVLWELVQLGLEHPGLTGGDASDGGDSTGFLYPFLDATETDVAGLSDSMTASARAKRNESHDLADATRDANDSAIRAAAERVGRRMDRGGRIFAFGNGGSACDAAQLVRLLRSAGRRATCLASDPAVLTALANDLGADHIFARQLEAVLGPDDVMVVFSTSGSSPNLLRALDVPGARQACVVACAGYGGGPLAQHPNVDHCLVVDSSSVHRIQEAQGVLIGAFCNRLAVLNSAPVGVAP